MEYSYLLVIAFGVVVLIASLRSWIFGKILRSRPHVRPIPATALHPCQLLSAVKLSQAFESGVYTSRFVTDTYIAHIERVNPYINAVVFELFDEARAQADHADRLWTQWRRDPSRHAKPHWLTGVPCTIKECIHVKGCPNTSGHPNRKHIVAQSDSACVTRLRAAGCVFLGVTNVSELCMWMESNNKVYGITCNPYDPRCLVGGSSGGEGASVASCCAPFGLGSDVGGSIRMPAFFNGLFGYKASSHLIPNRGQHPGARGQINHLLTTGPICRFAEDVLPLSLVLSEGGFLEDPALYPPCPPLPGQLSHLKEIGNNVGTPARLVKSPIVAPILPKKLRVYALLDLGVLGITVHEEEKRAVIRAATHLKERYGAEMTVLDLKKRSQCSGPVPPAFEYFPVALPMWTAHMAQDKSELTFIQFMSEGRTDTFEPYSETVKWIFGRSAHTFMSIGLCLIERTEELVFGENPPWKRAQAEAGHKFRAELQELLSDDAIIICPTYPMPAPRHHEPTWLPIQWQYTGVFNLLRMPAVNAPMWDERVGPNAPSWIEGREEGRSREHHVPKGVQVVGAWGNDVLPLSVVACLERDGVSKYRYPSWAAVPSS